MKLAADNRVLTRDQPKTILTTAVSATGTTLTVKNNGGFSQNDFVLIGNIGEEKTEIKRISSAVSAGTSLTIVAMTFDHDIDTIVTKIDYDQIRFYRGGTSTASASTALAAAQAIEPSEIYTYYEDTVYTTGYGFVRFYDATGATYSVYSDAIPYTGYPDKSLRMIRKKIRRLLNEPDETQIDNEEINEEINLAQREVAHDRLWSFYEKVKSFSSVEDQFEYSLASDVFKAYVALYKTQPLAIIELQRWNNLRWGTDVTGNPTHICIWRKKAKIYPYPDADASADTLDGDLTASATTITVDATDDFKTQGRLIIDNEVISYTGLTSTTFTGCTRGIEDTTAASHSDGVAITERDFIYSFQEEPSNLADETDETLIPEPSVVAYRAAAELALQKEDDVLHDRLITRYERAMVQLRKVDEPKLKGTFGIVKNQESVVYDHNVARNPNDYPTSISG